MKRLHVQRILRIIFLLAIMVIPSTTGVFGATTVGLIIGAGGLGDESFNDMAYKGLGQVGKQHGLKIITREWREPIPMEQVFNGMVEDGADLIIFNGGQFQALLERFAPVHPEIQMIANDFIAGDYPNVKSIVYSQHEAAFLAGVLAGRASATGKIGFVGGHDIQIIRTFQAGFQEGVEYASQKATVRTTFIGEKLDYSGFSSPQKAYEIATTLYKQGVDIIFAVAGMSGNGIIQAAKKNEKYVIGVDSDQDHMAKGYVLTSVMKRMDIAIYNEIEQAIEGEFTAGTVWYGLRNGGVSLSPMRFTKESIGDETLEALELIKGKIINGEIVVSSNLSSKEPAGK